MRIKPTVLSYIATCLMLVIIVSEFFIEIRYASSGEVIEYNNAMQTLSFAKNFVIFIFIILFLTGNLSTTESPLIKTTTVHTLNNQYHSKFNEETGKSYHTARSERNSDLDDEQPKMNNY